MSMKSTQYAYMMSDRIEDIEEHGWGLWLSLWVQTGEDMSNMQGDPLKYLKCPSYAQEIQ